MEPAVVFSGYLLKKAPALMGWRRRFFVLHAGGLLRCYEGDTDMSTVGTSKPLMEVFLTDTSRVEPVHSPLHGFRITLPHTTILLAAETADDFTVWFRHLQQATVSPDSSSGLDGSETPRTQRVERSECETKPLTRKLSRHSVLGKEFVVDARYEQLKGIGQGAYGIVVSCTDTLTQKKVAIKKISQLFDDAADAKRIIREIRFMRCLSHPNILSLADVFDPMSPDFNELYIASELMDTDLHKVIRSGQTLTEDHQRFIMYQLTLGLDHLHASGIIHRDLKPSNILLSLRCEVKICDFGLARVENEFAGDGEGREKMTEYVVTRWYRAPEIMLSSGHYTTSVDLWAAGCIFAEMQLSDPLFKGKNYIQQLKLIAKFLGSPSEQDLDFIKKPRAKDFMQKLPHCPPVSFTQMFPRLSIEGRNLMKRMLKFKPDDRTSARDALRSSYFDNIRNHQHEALPASLVEADDIESCPLQVPNLRVLMVQEINRLHAPNPSQESADAPEESPQSSHSDISTSNSQSPSEIPSSSHTQPQRRSKWRDWLPRYSSASTGADAPIASRKTGLQNDSRQRAGSDDDLTEEDVRIVWNSQRTSNGVGHAHTNSQTSDMKDHLLKGSHESMADQTHREA